MSLKVIGAGFGRTGTLSLKRALEQLGFGPCYHMAETRHHPDHDAAWLALARGETTDWHSVLTDYQATVDWPGVHFWKMLAAANPDAKIILTVRDPDRWYDSADQTIFRRMREFAKVLARGEDGTMTAPSAAISPAITRSACSTPTTTTCAPASRPNGFLSTGPARAGTGYAAS
jgi:hypothetical protein